MTTLFSDQDKRSIVSKLLKDMWTGHHFSICEVDKCLKILDLQRPVVYDEWSKMHCINWKDMPSGIPEKIMTSVIQELTKVNMNSLIDHAFRNSRHNGELLLLGLDN